MICSFKKISSLFLLLIGLSGSFTVSMPSRLSQRTGILRRALARSTANRSLVRHLLPNPRLRIPLTNLRSQIQPQQAVFPRPLVQPRTVDAGAPKVQAAMKQSNLESIQSKAQAPAVKEQRESASDIVRKRMAQQRQQQTASEAQVSKPKAPASQRPKTIRRSKAEESTLEKWRLRMRRQGQQSIQNAPMNIVREPRMPLIAEPSVGAAAQAVSQQPPMALINISTPIQAKSNIEPKNLATIQPEALQVTKARIAYNNAMRALDSVLNGLERLLYVKPNEPEYPQLHNHMRQALVAAQKQGYAIGFIDKKLVERVGALPGSQRKLLQNQPDASGMIIPAQSLGLVGAAQASGIAQALGLQGDFVPFIYKVGKNALPAAGTVFDPAFEIVRASMSKNNPFDNSKIVIQSMAQQLMPPAHNADMHLVELPSGNGNGGNNNNGLQDNDAHQSKKAPVAPTIPNRGGSGQSMAQTMNVMRNLGGASLDNDQPQSDRTIENEVERNVPNAPAVGEPVEVEPKESMHTASGQTCKIQREKTPSQEESAIAQYGNLILQALIARTYLQMEWAGQSQVLHAMFVDYNALLTQYRTINDQFSNTAYTDSNQRIYQVVSMVLNSLMGAKN